LKPQAELHLTSWNDFCRLVLEIIAELSPCSEQRLLIVAANRKLERFSDGSLGNLSKLLHQCVQELQARGLVEISGEQLVITPARSAEDEDIAELELHSSLRPSKLDKAPTNQKPLQTQAHVAGAPKRASEPTGEEIIVAAMRRFISDESLAAQADTERTPEPTMEEVPAAIHRIITDHETDQAKRQTEAPQVQADEESEGEAGNEIMTEGNGPLEAHDDAERASGPTMEEIVVSIRQIITDYETGQAKRHKEAPQAQADEEGEGEEIIDDIARVLNGGDAAAVVDEEEVLDLTAELGGVELVEDDDQPMVEVTETDETLDLDEPESSALERAMSASKAGRVPASATPPGEPFQFETAPQQAKAGMRLESSRELVSMPEPTGEPKESELVLTEAAEMMRDIVMALLVLALAIISVMSWFGGKPSVITVLILVALLLVGSAVWGWRGR
jgi:hypothetical protein